MTGYPAGKMRKPKPKPIAAPSADLSGMIDEAWREAEEDVKATLGVGGHKANRREMLRRAAETAIVLEIMRRQDELNELLM